MIRLLQIVGLIIFPASLLWGQNIDYVSSALFSGNCGCVCTYGGYAYIGSGGNLLALSIADPDNPILVNNCPMPPSGKNFISGNYIYYASWPELVSIVDISNPAQPVLVTSFRTQRPVLDLYKAGNYLYIANYDAGLFIADVSDPLNPFRITDYFIPGYARAIWVSGNYAYIASDDTGLVVVDISDPYHPNLVGASGSYQDGIFNDVRVSGDYAFIADRRHGLLVYNISTPSSPQLMHAFYPNNGLIKMVISDTIIYAASPNSWLYVIGISNPRSPYLIGSYISRVDLNNLWLSGSNLFLSRDEGNIPGGVDVVDISNPAAPTRIGIYEYNRSHQRSVAIRGNYVYSGQKALFSVDATDPSHPLVVGRNDTLNSIGSISISGDYAYITRIDSDLQVINLGNPSSPHLVGQLHLPRPLGGVCIRQPYIYIAAGSDGLDIIDISDPAHPSIVGNYDTDAYIMDVSVYDNIAYLTEANYVLEIVDVQDPAYPVVLGNWHNSSDLRGVIALGNYVYTWYYGGIYILDVSDPSHPILLGTFNTLYDPGNVVIEGNYAYVTESSPGMEIIDISNIQNPIRIAYHEDYGNPYSFVVSGDFIYVADDYSLNILRFPLTLIDNDVPITPGEPSILQCYPDPFNSSVTITAGNIDGAEIDIYDIVGRFIARLTLKSHKAIWDAASFPSGVYFARLETGEKSQNIKMVLLK